MTYSAPLGAAKALRTPGIFECVRLVAKSLTAHAIVRSRSGLTFSRSLALRSHFLGPAEAHCHRALGSAKMGWDWAPGSGMMHGPDGILHSTGSRSFTSVCRQSGVRRVVQRFRYREALRHLPRAITCGPSSCGEEASLAHLGKAGSGPQIGALVNVEVGVTPVGAFPSRRPKVYDKLLETHADACGLPFNARDPEARAMVRLACLAQLSDPGDQQWAKA